MAEYIEREVAFKMITDLQLSAQTKAVYAAIWESARVLNKIPAANVAEVVRCKDCKHYDEEYNLCILRSEEGDPNPNSDFGGIEFTTDINDFCSYGERKELDNG